MSDQSNEKIEQTTVQQSNDAQPARRAWLKKVGLAAPAFLLLHNRPAMAMGCSISGFMSVRVGTSLTTHDSTACNGWSPGNWKNDRGQITLEAWNEAGVSPNTPFNVVFNTGNLNGLVIRRFVNGVPDNGTVSYDSQFSTSFMDVLHGAINLGNGTKSKSVTKHAAAAFLNATFIANADLGSSPDPWMLTYIASADVVGLYLLYELSVLNPNPSGVTYQLQRVGVTVADTQFFGADQFKEYFNSIADGGGSDAFQDGRA